MQIEALERFEFLQVLELFVGNACGSEAHSSQVGQSVQVCEHTSVDRCSLQPQSHKRTQLTKFCQLRILHLTSVEIQVQQLGQPSEVLYAGTVDGIELESQIAQVNQSVVLRLSTTGGGHALLSALAGYRLCQINCA